jgi:alkaline phosphatase D
MAGLAWAGLAAACGAPPIQAPAAVDEPPPLPDASAVLERIAFASCIDQTQAQPIWNAVSQARPQLLIFGGDNVYASGQPWQRAALDKAYATLAAHADFARVRRELPALAIWDDHDYGLNDGGAEFEHKQASKAAFLQFWREPPDSARRQHDGLYLARSFGPPGRRVQIILLDTRWFRSPLKPTPARDTTGAERYVPDADPAKTMLGFTQWRWLRERLAEPADLRLVVSSVQVLAEGHGFERWGNLPLERQRLFDLIASTRANGVVFLSGDRHIGALYRQDADTVYPLYEMTSSGITHPWRTAAEPGPNRLGALFGELHFGLVRIDWTARTLSLELRGIGNRVQREVTISLAQLRVS